uniref:Uncharacterized protein n=1 Tax=Ditylenchus dipsaci TaxID=166011 RepID=A0A915EMN1_9BILA
MIIVPLFIQQMSYLLLHNPEGVDLDKFKLEIEEQFPNTECTHLHIFRHYPGNGFEVFMDIKFLPENGEHDVEEEKMYQLMEARTDTVLRGVRSVLQKAGATRVTIQPHYTTVTALENGTAARKIRG